MIQRRGNCHIGIPALKNCNGYALQDILQT